MIVIEFQDYEIDLSLIKPKNIRKSDKYSKCIYKYLKDNPRLRRVWYDESAFDDTISFYDGCARRPFDANNMDLRNLYFGLPEPGTVCITGKCLTSLTHGGRGSQETFSYIGYKCSNYIEVTKEFYEKYIEIGRCIYGHGMRIADDEGRFTYLEDKHRKCNWCGHEEHLVEKTYTHTYDVWE